MIKNAKSIFNARKDIINAFKKDDEQTEDEQTKEEEETEDKKLPDWVEVSRERFDEIKEKLANAKKINYNLNCKKTKFYQ